MNPTIRKPNCASRRWRARRTPPAPKPFNSVREPFVAVANTGKSKRPPAFRPSRFDVLAHAKAATAQITHAPSESPGRWKLGGKIPGIPRANRKPKTVAAAV